MYLQCYGICFYFSVYFSVYLSHLPDTQVNRANIQNIPVVQNRSFMRNKGHVFCFFFVSEHLSTTKISCWERVRKYRVH